MRVTPWLHVRTLHASRAEEALFVSLCELRKELIHVQPEVAPEDDYASFRSFFKGDTARVSLICTRDGTIEGFLGWHMRALDLPASRVAVIDSDYYFVKPSLRGHVVLTQVALGCYARAALHGRCRRVVIVGHGYPASVLSGGRFSQRVRFLQDTDLETWEREAMRHFAERFCGASFDRARGVVKMRTRPVETRRVPRSTAARDTLARFERYNPDWERGYGLPYILHLSPGSIARGALQLTTT
jgi:hypothetical protein